MSKVKFPSPLEVIGGSYKYWDRYESKSISGFPYSLEVTGVLTVELSWGSVKGHIVSVPSRGDWGF